MRERKQICMDETENFWYCSSHLLACFLHRTISYSLAATLFLPPQTSYAANFSGFVYHLLENGSHMLVIMPRPIPLMHTHNTNLVYLLSFSFGLRHWFINNCRQPRIKLFALCVDVVVVVLFLCVALFSLKWAYKQNFHITLNGQQ